MKKVLKEQQITLKNLKISVPKCTKDSEISPQERNELRGIGEHLLRENRSKDVGLCSCCDSDVRRVVIPLLRRGQVPPSLETTQQDNPNGAGLPSAAQKHRQKDRPADHNKLQRVEHLAHSNLPQAEAVLRFLPAQDPVLHHLHAGHLRQQRQVLSQ